jgi:hypothetical protein
MIAVSIMGNWRRVAISVSIHVVNAPVSIRAIPDMGSGSA